MPRRVARTAIAVGVLATTLALGSVLASPAGATVSTNLPFATLGPAGDIVVDSVHHRIFVSSGGTSSTLAVLDLSGRMIATATLDGGTGGLALNGNTLYVAESAPAGVVALDATTLARIHTYSTAPYAPTFLAYERNRIWFGYGPCGTVQTGMASINLATGGVTTYTGQQFPTCPRFVVSPLVPGILFSYNVGVTGSNTIWKFDVSHRVPTLLAQVTTPSGVYPTDMGISPDGASLWVLGPAYPYDAVELRTSDLQPTGQRINAGPNPVALSPVPGGQGVAIGLGSFAGNPTLQVLDRGASTRRFGFNLADPAQSQVIPRGVRAAPDGRHLFALTVAPGRATLNSVVVSNVSGPATMSAAVPNVGPTSGGQLVTVTGQGMRGTSEVMIGVPGSSITVRSDTEIQFRTPAAAAAGDALIFLLGPGGWTYPTAAPGYTYNLAFTPTFPTPGGGSTAWPTDHLNAGRTAVYSQEQLITPANAGQLVRHWATTLGSPVTSPPVVVNGLVYIAANDGTLNALDARTGAQTWRFNGQPGYLATPTVDGGAIIFVDESRTLYRLDAKTGAVLWQVALGSTFASSPLVMNGRIYVALGSSMAAYDEQSGVLVWDTPLGPQGAVVSTPASDGTVIVASSADSLFAFDGTTGTVLWAKEPGAYTNFGPPAIGNRRVYISQQQNLWAIDVVSGTVDWIGGLPNSYVVTSPPVVTTSVVYVEGHALDAATGASMGPGFLGLEYDSGVVAGDLFIGGLYVSQISSHELLYAAPGCCVLQTSAPAVVNGAIYIVTGGRVLAYGLPNS